MKRSLYRERDYAFGQLMLTLRTHMGLTQASLAKLLGISRRAVSTWELGSNYPASAHLKELIVLGVELRVFAAGREAEEIRSSGVRRTRKCCSMSGGSKGCSVPSTPGLCS
jgi:transcriptional regulator with XRE-family HTH domain